MVFTTIELRDILISVIALALVFSYPESLSSPFFFLASLFTVGIAFMGHELSHKFAARRRGFFASYRMWPQGLLLAFIFAIATGGGIVFAAPGAVYFGSRRLHGHSKRDIGVVGLAGPAFNILLFLLLLPAYALTAFPLLLFAALINVWLALFNLIPVPPLDGSKVLAWNPMIWTVSLAISAAGFAGVLLL